MHGFSEEQVTLILRLYILTIIMYYYTHNHASFLLHIHTHTHTIQAEVTPPIHAWLFVPDDLAHAYIIIVISES